MTSPIRRRRCSRKVLPEDPSTLLLSALPVHAHSISAAEASAFRLVNHLPSVPFAVVWAPMQLGNFLIVPVAVVTALAVVAAPWLPRWARWVVAVAVAAVFFTMYAGAQLLLDVVGGAALGWAAGVLVHLVLGAPQPRVSIAKVRAALLAHGLDPTGLRPLGSGGRRSTRFVTGPSGLFVKVVVPEWRDTDLLYRAWHWLFRRREPRPARCGIPLHDVEHEAAMALLAATAGVRTPRVLLVGPFGESAGLLVQRRIHGRELDPGRAGEELASELRHLVEVLHRAGIVHGDLESANVVVDEQGRPWLVDFDQAMATTDGWLLARDGAPIPPIPGLGDNRPAGG